DLPVEVRPLLEVQVRGSSADLPFYDAGALQLQPAIGHQRAVDAAANHRVAGEDVADDFPTLPEYHRLARLDGSHDRSFHAHRAVGGQIALDAHPRADDRDRPLPGRGPRRWSRAVTIGLAVRLAEYRHGVSRVESVTEICRISGSGSEVA